VTRCDVKDVPGRISVMAPLSIAAVARPETTMPTCSTEQLDAPAAGPTWSDHLQPGRRSRGQSSCRRSAQSRTCPYRKFEFRRAARTALGSRRYLSHRLVVEIAWAPGSPCPGSLPRHRAAGLCRKDLVADEESRRPECTAGDRTLCIVEQARLDIGILDQLLEAVCIETRFEQGGPQYRRIIELFGFRPHVPIDFVDIALEDAEPLNPRWRRA